MEEEEEEIGKEVALLVVKDLHCMGNSVEWNPICPTTTKRGGD